MFSSTLVFESFTFSRNDIEWDHSYSFKSGHPIYIYIYKNKTETIRKSSWQIHSQLYAQNFPIVAVTYLTFIIQLFFITVGVNMAAMLTTYAQEQQHAVIQFVGRTIAHAVSRRLTTAAAWVQTRVWSCGILWWTKVTRGQVFSENFGFPCQSTFHL
jgi:hypothetical protein